MVQCGASVGAYDNKGRPPIQRAIRYNWPEIGIDHEDGIGEGERVERTVSLLLK